MGYTIHARTQDYYVDQKNGKYYVSSKVNNGNIGASMQVFDSPEEVNKYLQKVGVDESLFLDVGKDAGKSKGLQGGVYSQTIGDIAEFSTKYSLLNLATGGKYAEKTGEMAEHMARYSGINLMEQAADKIGSSAYSEGVGKFAKFMTKYSLLNWMTGGKYSENAEKYSEKMARFSLINLVLPKTSA